MSELNVPPNVRDEPNGVLPATTTDGQARTAALQAAHGSFGSATSLITYHSGGHLLVIGAVSQAQPVAESLARQLNCTLLVDSGPEGGHEPSRPGVEPEPETLNRAGRLTVLGGQVRRLEGHLGAFTVTVAGGDGEVDLAALVDKQRAYFDLVLDLTRPGHLRREILPPGYYAPGDDAGALQAAVDEIPQLVGDFEKPKYFNYNPDICAHGSSGIRGCTRCLDACPAEAISSIGEKVEVDPYLCQGGGSCATACPTGAITYVFPNTSTLLGGIREALRAYREAGGVAPCVLFHDAEAGATLFTRLAPQVPERIVPIQIEEIGAVGMDTWLASLAYGAAQVVLLASAATPRSVSSELREQISYAGALVKGMGYRGESVRLITHEDDADVVASLQDSPSSGLPCPPGTFAPFDEKRTTIGLAVDHLYAHAPAPRPLVALPAGAPFGEVWLNEQRCTLCMACASVCPAGALLAGDDLPQLKFVEDNCVQCGLCARTCPEDAIGPSPRYLYQRSKRLETRLLYEEQPFGCVVCGKPFATQKMMDKVLQKLSGHPMFQTPEALHRLKMCEDCRVKDMFAREAGGPGQG